MGFGHLEVFRITRFYTHINTLIKQWLNYAEGLALEVFRITRFYTHINTLKQWLNYAEGLAFQSFGLCLRALEINILSTSIAMVDIKRVNKSNGVSNSKNRLKIDPEALSCHILCIF